ncbi:MAG: transporter substrate-binding domain-containing protein [Ignavibacteriaceae bacterium]|nr:transporter substrate-binding domain-containing protein [Ignavibacteriaceae bacterium]
MNIQISSNSSIFRKNHSRLSRKVLPLVFLTPLLLIIFSACSEQNRDEDQVCRIGYAIETPYVFYDDDGNLTGTEIELAKLVLDSLKIKNVEWYHTEFGLLIPELQSKRFDVIAAGMFVTPEREKEVKFSKPSFIVNQALLVPFGNPKKIFSYSDCITLNIKSAVLYSSIEEQILRKIGIAESLLVLVPDALTGVAAVKDGIADALALSSPTLSYVVTKQKEKQFEVINQKDKSIDFISLHKGAFAFRKDDIKNLNRWDFALSKIVGSDSHMAILSKFGMNKNNIPNSEADK